MTTSAREASSRLADLLRREHAALAEFLVALAAFDREGRWAELGHASLFSFLRRDLGLSAGAAQYRKTAAELVQQYPQVEAALRDGRLCLSTVIELAKVITPGNVAELLPRFFGLSARDAAFVAASIRPVESPPVRDFLVTPVRVGAATVAASIEAGAASREPDAFRTSEVNPSFAGPIPASSGAASAPACRDRPTVRPLDADRARVNMTVPRRLLEKLAAARDALSHSHPGASEEQILELGLDLILQRHAKRRGLVANPRAPKATAIAAAVGPAVPLPASAAGSPGSIAPGAPSVPRREPIPAHVKRAVWRRDGGRCQWPLQDAGVCESTLRVQLDHVVPVALGGRPTVENLRCLCAAHNVRAAREVFGGVHMDRFTNPRSAPGP